MFANNKTASWLNTKTLKEREELMKKAWSISPEFKQFYKIRRQRLLEEHAKLLQAKRLQLERLQVKKLKRERRISTGNIKVWFMAIKAPNSGGNTEIKNQEGESSSTKTTT